MARASICEGRFRRVYDLAKSGRREGGVSHPPRAGWVYLPMTAVPDKAARRRLRGRLVRIAATETGSTIHRRLAFGARLRRPDGDAPGEIGLDWDSWIELQDGQDEGDLSVEVTPSRSLLAWAGIGHPDPTVHAAATLGVVGLLLGALSLALAVIPWITSVG
ncbi:MAG: hypothetical protein D6705_03310 [Deltaproteobacteria bacterium]|nr:MAG: hypothetical protein D6705_03310 [Deltaproteobacteria bacterium]